MNVLVFDIETVPDVETGRRLHGMDDVDDEGVAKALAHLRLQESGSEFLRLHLHRIVAIGAVLKTRDRVRVWSLGEESSDEAELIRRFFAGIERYEPTLVSWNGGGFDLPVLHYRALRHGIVARRYWDQGEDDQQMRWNNYINRYHQRHLDLMDVLSHYQLRASVRLDDLALLLGFPGKLGQSGADVWSRFLAGDLRGIREYCESDVLNTYLIYLRFELMRGRLSREQYDANCAELREHLLESDQAHLRAFADAWSSVSADGSA